MKKLMRRIILITIILFVLGMIIGCSPSGRAKSNPGATKDMESRGKWKFEKGKFGNTQSGDIAFTPDGTLYFWVHQAGYRKIIDGSIHSYDNDAFNDSTTGEGDFGHAVVKICGGDILTPTFADPSARDQYVVVRWQSLEKGKKIKFAISKGDKYFDHRPTPEEAIKDLTTESNYREWLTAELVDPLLTPEEMKPIEIEGSWRKEHTIFKSDKFTITVKNNSTTENAKKDYSMSVVDDKGTLRYQGKIIKYNNLGLNAGEEGKGDCGYAVVKLEAGFHVEGNSDSYVGKFAIMRWDNLEGSSVDIVMSNTGSTMTVADTESEAEEINSFWTSIHHFTFKGATKQ